MHHPTLDYRTPDPTPSPRNAAGAAALPSLCMLPPIAGYFLQIGILFLAGGLLPFAGLAWSVVGMLINIQKPTAPIWAASALVNGVGSYYFFELLFVRGLC